MNENKKQLLLAICLAGLVACASTASDDRYREPNVAENARTIVCGDDQVAFCIEVDCAPEDYYCTDRGDVRKMFKAGEFRH